VQKDFSASKGHGWMQLYCLQRRDSREVTVFVTMAMNYPICSIVSSFASHILCLRSTQLNTPDLRLRAALSHLRTSSCHLSEKWALVTVRCVGVASSLADYTTAYCERARSILWDGALRRRDCVASVVKGKGAYHEGIQGEWRSVSIAPLILTLSTIGRRVQGRI